MHKIKITNILIFSLFFLSICSCKDETVKTEKPFEEKTLAEKVVGKWKYTTLGRMVDGEMVLVPYPSTECGYAYFELRADHTYSKFDFDVENECKPKNEAGQYKIDGTFFVASPSNGKEPFVYIVNEVKEHEASFTLGDIFVNFTRE